jgi:hypothetical protein
VTCGGDCGCVSCVPDPPGWLEFAEKTAFTGEKKDIRGRRLCYANGRRVACGPKADAAKGKAAAKAPAAPTKPTVDDMHGEVAAFRKAGGDPKAVASRLNALTVPQLRELQGKLGDKPAAGLKAERVQAVLGMASAKAAAKAPAEPVSEAPPAGPASSYRPTPAEAALMPDTTVTPPTPDAMKKKLRGKVRLVIPPAGDDRAYTFVSADAKSHAAVAATLRKNGWDVVSDRPLSNHVVAYPLEKRDKPAVAYHLVPRKNLKAVLKDGLLPGSAERSTKAISSTHGVGKVFLTDDPKALDVWRAQFQTSRRGKTPKGEELVPLRVDLSGTKSPAYADHGAATIDKGALYLVGEAVPPSALSLVPGAK